MDFVVCQACGHPNPALRAVCESCGKGLADDLDEHASMPRPSTHLAGELLPMRRDPSALAVAEVRLGIITFASTASWLVRPEPVTRIGTLPPIKAGGNTNLGAALDLIASQRAARVVISDLDITAGQPWRACLSRIQDEHRSRIRWGVIGIREPGCSWNHEAPQAASNANLYLESRYDAGLAHALIHLSHTILEVHHANELLVLLDTSSSMQEGGKWRAAQEALAALVRELQDGARHPLTQTLKQWLG